MSSILRKIILLLVLVLAGVLPAAAPLAAQTGTGLIQFVNAGTVDVKWPEDIVFGLYNNTAEPIEATVRLDHFLTAEGAMVPELPRDFTTTVELAAAAEGEVVIPLDDDVEPDAGTYTATIVAYASAGERQTVIRKAVQVVKSEAENPPMPFIPAVKAYTFTAYRILPMLAPWCVGCNLPIEDVAGAMAIENFGTGDLGYLVSDAGGALRVQQGPISAKGGVQLRFDFDRWWGNAGAYTGEIDFLPAVEDEGAVTLTVNVKDNILIPVLLLALGILLATAMQHWIGVRRKLILLEERRAQAEVTFRDLKAPINGYSIESALLGEPDGKLHWLKREFEDLDRGFFQSFDEEKVKEEDKSRYDRALETLEQVEEAVDGWTEFRDQLGRLQDALHTMGVPPLSAAPPAAALPHPGIQQPVFYSNALALLQGQALTLDEFKAFRAALDDSRQLAADWNGLQAAVLQTRDRLNELAAVRGQMTEAEEAVLDAARMDAHSAWADLWSARDAGDLARREARAELEAAQDGVQRLLHHLPDQSPPVSAKWAAMPSLELGALPQEPAARARAARQALIFGDRALIWIAFVVALVTGLSELYFPANFGAWSDWLAALTWGLGAKAAVEVLNAALGRWFPHSK